eukprot:365866-Chlamydomonas_euryale.AAC.7
MSRLVSLRALSRACNKRNNGRVDAHVHVPRPHKVEVFVAVHAYASGRGHALGQRLDQVLHVQGVRQLVATACAAHTPLDDCQDSRLEHSLQNTVRVSSVSIKYAMSRGPPAFHAHPCCTTKISGDLKSWGNPQVNIGVRCERKPLNDRRAQGRRMPGGAPM